MGADKLLLPWKQRTVIDVVLSVWRASQVDRIVVVVSPSDDQLARLVRTTGVDVVVPSAPPADMKSSVAIGLEHARRLFHPQPSDRWLLAPADMPTLQTASIDSVLFFSRGVDAATIVAPSFGGRRGHPISLPWALADEVHQLSADEGINRLVARHRVVELPLEDPGIREDLDTPADYQRLLSRDDAP